MSLAQSCLQAMARLQEADAKPKVKTSNDPTTRHYVESDSVTYRALPNGGHIWYVNNNGREYNRRSDGVYHVKVKASRNNDNWNWRKVSGVHTLKMIDDAIRAYKKEQGIRQ